MKRKNGYWNRERVIKTARVYKTIREFRLSNPSAYSAAHKNGWIHAATKHMVPTVRDEKWSYDAIQNEAKKYKTKKEFRLGSGGAYSAAQKKRIMPSVTAHMVLINQPTGYWNESRILSNAKKYQTIAEFRKAYPGAYAASLRLNLSNKLRKILRPGKRLPYWNAHRIELEAKKYKYRSDFKNKSTSAYTAAWRSQILDRVCRHMRIKAKPKGFYTPAKIRELARLYKSKSEFKSSQPTAYAKAHEFKIIESVCKHMPNRKKPNSYWTEEVVRLEALKYKTIKDFRANCPSAYSKAKTSGWLKRISTHMVPTPRPVKWTKEAIQAEALKYKSKSEFERMSPAGYSAALKKKLINEVSKHMIQLQKPHRWWSKERVLKLAKEFKHLGDFKKAHPGAYGAAQKNKWMGDLRKFLETRPVQPYWTESVALKEAKKYKDKREFRLKAPGAYDAVLSKGLMAKASRHMDTLGNKYRRAIYAFEFEDRSVYIGLTFDFTARLRQHKKTGLLRNKIGSLDYKYKCFDKWYSPKSAQNAEAKMIDKYKQKGWTILNRAKAGALGGGERKWTFEEVLRVAKTCATRTEFRNKYPGAAWVAYQKGWDTQITKHMKRLRAKKTAWTWKMIESKAEKYRNYGKFIRANKLMYAAAMRNGWLKRLQKLFE